MKRKLPIKEILTTCGYLFLGCVIYVMSLYLLIAIAQVLDAAA